MFGRARSLLNVRVPGDAARRTGRRPLVSTLMRAGKRAGLALARWVVAASVMLLVLELACRAFVLSNDSLPVDFVADPYLSYRMKAGSHGVSAFGIPFEINSFGLRNREIAVPKPPGVFRILVLGDSVTLGYGMPLESTYPRLLEQMVGDRHVEVISAGASGYNIQNQVAYLEHYGLSLEPDMILCGFTKASVEERVEFEIHEGVGYEPGRSRLIPPALKKLLRHSRLYLAVAYRRANMQYGRAVLGDVREDFFRKRSADVVAALTRLRVLCDEHRLPLMVSYIPVQVEVARGTGGGIEYPALVPYLSALEGPTRHFLNVLPAFVARRDIEGEYLSHDTSHPSALGHRLIAQTIFDDPFFRAVLPGAITSRAQ